MNIVIPYLVDYIINILQQHEYQAYMVGGCVRDMLLKRKPNDWDVTTSATPEEIKKVFDGKLKIIDTGLKHGTVTLMMDYAMDNSNIFSVEVTTFRVDGEYSDNRRPDKVEFTTSLVEDLSRRDFTCNAIAFNKKEGIIDPFFGTSDVYSKIIKCVGNPHERFKEDALRMLRALRFKAQLGFSLDSFTWKAIHDNYDLIKNVSVERITQEINKILLSDPLEIYSVDYFGLLKYTIPELNICFWTNQDNPYHCYSVGKHLIYSAKEIKGIPYLKLTMLLHDIAKPQCKTVDDNGIGHFYDHAKKSSEMAVDILKRMRYDNFTINKVKELIYYHDIEIQDNRKSVRKWLNKIGEDNFRDLLKVREADIKAQNLNYYQERHEKLERIKHIFEEVLKEEECFTVKDLAINGNDLIQIGIKEGVVIGDILKRLLDMVLDDPSLNNKNNLIKISKEIIKETK